MPSKSDTKHKKAQAKNMEPKPTESKKYFTPPKFTIDLSLPPQNRYDHVSSSPAMKESLKNAHIPELFDAILEELVYSLPFGLGSNRSGFVPKAIKSTIRGLARIALRKVYTHEETDELKGLARGTGIPMFLLVCFNVLLDLLMGCTSGGALFDARTLIDDSDTGNGHSEDRDVDAGHHPAGENGGHTTGRFRQTAYRRAKQQAGATSSSSSTTNKRGSSSNGQKPPTQRIAHFRTLDWGMDPLRHLVVELEYVRHEGGPVIARTIGYFGYVGVLTGIRTGLSMSLNHRAAHDRSTWAKRFSFRWNQLLVLLGMRPSISSTLRFILFNNNNLGHGYNVRDHQKILNWKAWSFLDLAHPRVVCCRTEAEEVELLPPAEKSELNVETIIQALPMSPSTSAYLIFCTAQKVYSLEVDNGEIVTVQSSATFLATTNHDIADESSAKSKSNIKGNPTATGHAAVCGMEEILEESMDRKKAVKRAYVKARRAIASSSSKNELGVALRLDDVTRLVSSGGIINRDVTHYVVFMDPGTGKILLRTGFWADDSDESDTDED